MYQQLIALDTSDLSKEQVTAYLHQMFRALGTGRGSSNVLASSLELAAADGMRFLLGVPEEWLTTERQRFAEAIYSLTFNTSAAIAHKRWRDDHFWTPRNPNAHENLAESIIDMEFLATFRLSDSGWEKVFRSSGLLTRTRQNSDSDEDRIRAFVSLSMFGFREPGQFFTLRKAVKGALKI